MYEPYGVLYDALAVDFDGPTSLTDGMTYYAYRKALNGKINQRDFAKIVSTDSDRFMMEEFKKDPIKVRVAQKLRHAILERKGEVRGDMMDIFKELYEVQPRIPIGIASDGSSKEDIEVVLNRSRARNYVTENGIVGSEDRGNMTKYQVLSQRMGIPTNKMIAIEDTIQGIESAIQSGVGKVYVVHGYQKKSDLIQDVNFLRRTGHENVIFQDRYTSLMRNLRKDFGLVSHRISKPPYGSR